MSKEKIGRNDPCWCGSGKKYKRCHYLVSEPGPKLAADVVASYRSSFRHRICLAPPERTRQCTGKIISAHTVPRSHLALIAREQHVYQIRADFSAATRQEFPFLPQLIGINQASTVSGFCAYHDNALFSALEKRPFIASDEQCFLLMYRAVAREVFQKIAAVKSHMERSRIFRERRIQLDPEKASFSEAYELGTKKGLADIKFHKAALDAIFRPGDFQQLRSYILELENAPNIMCSGAFFPECTFGGQFLPNHFKLGNLESTPPDLMSFSSMAGTTSGVVVFSWLPDSDGTCIPFMRSLEQLPDTAVGDALLRFFAEFCENTYFRPDWWDALSETDRTALIMRLATGGSPFHARQATCLSDDGSRLVDWPVRIRKRANWS